MQFPAINNANVTVVPENGDNPLLRVAGIGRHLGFRFLVLIARGVSGGI